MKEKLWSLGRRDSLQLINRIVSMIRCLSVYLRVMGWTYPIALTAKARLTSRRKESLLGLKKPQLLHPHPDPVTRNSDTREFGLKENADAGCVLAVAGMTADKRIVFREPGLGLSCRRGQGRLASSRHGCEFVCLLLFCRLWQFDELGLHCLRRKRS